VSQSSRFTAVKIFGTLTTFLASTSQWDIRNMYHIPRKILYWKQDVNVLQKLNSYTISGSKYSTFFSWYWKYI